MLGERVRPPGVVALAIAAMLAAALTGGARADGPDCPPTLSPAPQSSASSGATAATARPRPRRATGRRAAARRRRQALRRARRIRLVLEGAPATLSFARDRTLLDVPVAIKTTRPLPRTVKASDITIEAPGDMHRLGSNLVSVPRVVPLTSRPRITHARDRVYFSVCVDGHGLKAGSYVGSITVSGPTSRAHVDVPVVVTVKDASFFFKGVVIALLIAGAFLFYKELRNEDKVRYAAWVEKNRAVTGGKGHWWRNHRRFFFSSQSHYGIDFVLLELLVPIGAAFAAMYGIYATTPTWGSDGVTQWFSLITTAFTAAGVRSLIVAAVPSVGAAGRADEPRPARPLATGAVGRAADDLA